MNHEPSVIHIACTSLLFPLQSPEDFCFFALAKETAPPSSISIVRVEQNLYKNNYISSTINIFRCINSGKCKDTTWSLQSPGSQASNSCQEINFLAAVIHIGYLSLQIPLYNLKMFFVPLNKCGFKFCPSASPGANTICCVKRSCLLLFRARGAESRGFLFFQFK